MTDNENRVERVSGCGVQGCLFGAVALFVLLLIAMLVIAVIRFSQPPEGVSPARQPVTGHLAPDASAHPPAQPAAGLQGGKNG